MPAEIGHIQPLEHFKRHIGFNLGALHCVLRMPRPLKGLPAKRIAALPSKRMPVGHREPEVVFKPLSKYNFVRIVMMESHRVLAFWAFIGDGFDILEKLCHGRAFNTG